MSSSRPGATLYRRLILSLLRGYKLTLSPLIGTQCRYAPTCSEYAASALIAHGPVKGGWLAARRVCRCSPWGGSGYDPVPAGDVA
jgi:putative membrane protein insertion efficiency factor